MTLNRVKLASPVRRPAGQFQFHQSARRSEDGQTMAMLLLAILSAISCSFLAVNAEEIGCTVGNSTINVGEHHNFPGSCAVNICKGNNEWTTSACGLLGSPSGWTFVPEDPTKDYPECCSHVVPPLDIVPDVIDKLKWANSLAVHYDSGVNVSMGNELTPTQVKNKPHVKYVLAEPAAHYLLCMTDPDAPSRAQPTSREFLHWLVGNIPGSRISEGEELVGYVGSGPPRDTGLHRYVFLLYKQPSKLTFDEPRVTSTSGEHRPKFSIRSFAKKYNLGEPVALNVYQAQYDDYVPQVHQQLGLGKKN